MDEARRLKLNLAAELSEPDEPISWPEPELTLFFNRLGTYRAVANRKFNLFKAMWDMDERAWVPYEYTDDDHFMWVFQCPITNEMTPLYLIPDALGKVENF